MLHIIGPRERSNNASLLQQVFDKRDTCPTLPYYGIAEHDSFDTHEATYLIYVDDRYGLSGMARLLPTSGKHLTQYLTHEGIFDQAGWECSQIHLFMSPETIENYLENSETTIHIDQLATRFFQTLYDGVHQCSVDVGNHYIIMVAPECLHIYLKKFGWPIQGTSLVEQGSSLPSMTIGIMPVAAGTTLHH